MNRSGRRFSRAAFAPDNVVTVETRHFSPIRSISLAAGVLALAVLAWAPGSATLRTNGPAQEFDSVEALVAHATGSALPVAALFDWLRGTNTAVAGWQADLSQLENGRLRAQRHPWPPFVESFHS